MSQTRPSRPTGAVVTEKGNQLAPLPSEFSIEPASGDLYVPVDVLSLPRPVAPSSVTNPPPVHSVLMGNPLSPGFLSQGDHLTVANHRWLASHGERIRATKRPKHLVKSNKSTFISRGLVFESFTKRMRPEDPLESLVLTNFDRSIALMDYSSEGSCSEPLAKIFFSKAWPLCHSLNYATACGQQLDVIVGMSSGDLLWMDLVTQRYERLNKTNNLTHAPILAVSWVPHSDCLVVAAHADGILVVYDVHGEDTSEAVPMGGGGSHSVVVTSFSSTAARKRPQSFRAAYRLSQTNQRITQLQFISRSVVAVSAHNDYVKLFDLEAERVVELLPSLFGSVLSLAVSPDMRYLCIGGEDDLISIFELRTSTMVVRLAGHKAWVRGIAFDPFASDDTGYRLASVGEDQQVIVWDLTPATLTLPKSQPRVDIDDGLKYVSETHQYGRGVTVRGRILQSSAPTLFFAAKAKPYFEQYGEGLFSSIAFTPKFLLVASADGRIWSWRKQPQAAIGEAKH